MMSCGEILFQPVYALAIFLLLLMRSGVGLNSSIAGSGAEASRCIKRERQALLAFKQGVVDDAGMLSEWGSQDDRKDCCQWRGVQCNNVTGHVIGLDLHINPPYDIPHMSLGGNLGSSLFELQHLSYLDLSRNYIGGHIPESIGSLKKLKHLDLSWNGFSGSIPSQLRNLTGLEYLDISYNHNFDSVKNLEWLSHLYSLKYLNMSELNLSKAVDWLQVVDKLPYLTNLVLQNCSLPDAVLPSIPTINTSSLVVISLGRNNLSALIFQWLFRFSPSLVELDLSENHIQGLIPEALGIMTSLEVVDLEGNRLQGGIPRSVGNLCRLKALRLDDNYLDGTLSRIISNLSSGCIVSSLEELWMVNNQITGWFPDPIANFSSLKQLALSYNNISGSLPKSIGLLSNLEYLILYSNNISGVVTEEHFLKSSRLSLLGVSANQLSINFSRDWNPPFQLDLIALGSCMLGPEFPKWIKTQREFSYLDLSRSGISGDIPKWFWNLTSEVYDIDLSSNKLSGTLPDPIENFGYFPKIDMRSNCFEGPLPLFPVNVSSINLSNNSFSGSISSLCSITGGFLHFLDLSGNQLSGELPHCLNNWPNLVILNLANNKFSGKIPDSFGSLSMLQSFSLRNNSISGEIPWSLGNCSSLQFVDLSHNKFFGTIPYWIGEKLLKLNYLLLKSNNFHGRVPLQLCRWTDVLLLDFSFNYLSGSIPLCIHHMTALTRKETSIEDHVFTSFMLDHTIFHTRYADTTSIIWKGTGYEFHNIKNLTVIDFSSNELTGTIPALMWNLVGLVQLNLSRNRLTGRIPPDMEWMRRLESLDLSKNKLSGQLPQSMSRLDFLSKLDLSDNNFSGRIPSGAHIDTFSPEAIVGNPALCGPPLTSSCPDAKRPKSKSAHKDNNKDEFWKGFKLTLGIGAAFGFVGVLALKLDLPWKHVVPILFTKLKVWLKNLKDFLYLITATLAFMVKEIAAKMRRKLEFQVPLSVS